MNNDINIREEELQILSLHPNEGGIHDTVHTILNEMDIDVLVGCEPIKTIIQKPGQIGDRKKGIAIFIRNKNVCIESVEIQDSYLMINLCDFTIYCCYISLNISYDTYKDFVNKLMT